MAKAEDILEIDKPTTYEINLMIVEGDTAAYQIVRDNNVIENETITYESLPE